MQHLERSGREKETEENIEAVMATPDGVEATARYTADKKYVFLLNHAEDTKEVVADADYYDILNDAEIKAGERIEMPKTAVVILEK